MAELADARDLKSRETHLSYRFKPGFRHQTVFPQTNQYRGVEQLVARRAHNPEVVGSSPSPATISRSQKRYHGFEPPKSHDFGGFSRVSSLFRNHEVCGYRVQKKDIISKKRLRTGFEPDMYPQYWTPGIGGIAI